MFVALVRNISIKMSSKSLQYANEFVSFLNSSPTPYHAVDTIKKSLVKANFKELSEKTNWKGQVKKGGSYFVTRNGSSLIAFTVGQKWVPGNGVSIIGAHTDSPTLRVKPVSKLISNGYIQVKCETYGGGIFHSYFDRTFSIAGRLFITKNGKTFPKLVKVDKPILQIPTLAIHLDRSVNTKFEFNKETKLVPIAGLEDSSSAAEGNGKKEAAGEEKEHSCCGGSDLSDDEFHALDSVVKRHSPQLLDVIAQEAGVEVSEIEDFELILYDNNKSTLGGINNEFVFSGRLDNLTSCFCGTEAIIKASTEESLASEPSIRLLALFDHEEIGSQSAQGADSNFIPAVLDRLTSLTGNEASSSGSNISHDSYLYESSAKSFFLSSDMAHGVHPNYAENYEGNHKPKLNGGPVIKVNANQRYVTNSPGIVLLKRVAEKAKVLLQLFVVRNDSPCGSTIGPIVCSKLGIRALDIGNPQLSMHSIRETGGSHDVEKLISLFQSYYENYSEAQDSIVVDGFSE